MKTVHLLIFIVVVAVFPIAESRISSREVKQNYQPEDQTGYYDDTQTKYYKTNQKLTETTASRKLASPPAHRLNVTAWGIIGIILGLIILSTITYYLLILYPYICKKEQNYDIVELTDVNSVCTVSDNTVSDNTNMPPYHSSNNILDDISVNH